MAGRVAQSERMPKALPILSRPPDDLPPARVWRPELVRAADHPRPGLPVQPALFALPRRTSEPTGSTGHPFVDLLDAGSLAVEPPGGPTSGLRAGRHRPAAVQVSLVGAAPSPRLPDVRRWSVNLGVALVEVVLGYRALAQLLRWLDDDALRVLGVATSATRDQQPPVGLRERIAVTSARVQILGPQTVEVCLHATRAGDRVVVAFRLVAASDRWLCSELDLLTPRVRGRLVD